MSELDLMSRVIDLEYLVAELTNMLTYYTPQDELRAMMAELTKVRREAGVED